MNVKEAILQSLEDMRRLVTYKEVYEHIKEQRYNDFEGSKTPKASISAILGGFIRAGDSRVKRVNRGGSTFAYYLAKYEDEIEIKDPDENELEETIDAKTNVYQERDLHLLFSSYLKSQGIYPKTVFHEKSNSSDNHKNWIHPDMVGAKFLKLKSKVSNSLIKAVSNAEVFKLYSYELKREIHSDYELKKYFFQAVSNSSWANYGYLVAFDIDKNLEDELERLSQSFGIGVIKLEPNPFITKILYPSRYREIDIKTIDKLCKVNPDFENFIDQIEKVLTVENKFTKVLEKELERNCDNYLENEIEIEKYCFEHNIPIEQNDEPN